ncbi:MAG: HK97 gp10 family phage protein [Moorellales bacterium]
MSFRVEIVLSPLLSEILAEKREKVARALHRALTQLAAEGEYYAKKRTPVDTGRLRSSITWGEINPTTMQIGTNVFYAPFVLGDVKPFTIRVKNKKALAWVVYRGGPSKAIRPASDDKEGWKRLRKRGLAAYAKWVRHPGGKNIFGQTAEYIAKRAPNVVKRALETEGVT